MRSSRRSLDLLIVDGHEGVMSMAHSNIAEAALRLEQFAVAARHQRASLELGLALGQRVLVAYSILVAARIAARGGGWRDAVQLQISAVEMLEASSHRLYESDQRLGEELLAGASEVLGDVAFEDAVANRKAADNGRCCRDGRAGSVIGSGAQRR